MLRLPLIATLFIALGAPGAALAQTSNRLDAQVIFDALYDPVFNIAGAGGETTHAGAHFDVGVEAWKSDPLRLLVVGEIGFNHFTGDTDAGYFGGVRLPISLHGNPQLRPFGQFLLGVDTGGNENDFAQQFGGGVVYGLNPSLSLVLQYDFRRVPYNQNGGGVEHIHRFSVGVQLPIR